MGPNIPGDPPAEINTCAATYVALFGHARRELRLDLRHELREELLGAHSHADALGTHEVDRPVL
jgi:hypothetical protein